MRVEALLGLLALVLAIDVRAGVEGVPRIPAHASHVEDYTVPGSETLQASFRLRSAFPTSGIIDHYLAGVSELWARCESPRPGWNAYVDTSSGTQRVVHQLIRYWVSFEQRKMLTVIVRHYSRGTAVRCQPDDDTQHAVVVVSVSPKLSQEINLLGLACGVHAPALPLAHEPPPQCGAQ